MATTITCESCNETEATTRSRNPDYSGYQLCGECAAEYDSRLAMETTYTVFCVEQDSRRIWSRHETRELALAAARRYARRNPNSVVHLPFEVVSPDGTVTLVPSN